MRISPQADRFRARQVPLTDFRGSTTAEHFPEESAPGARLFDAPWRASLAVRGADARKWLNGMISANVRDLAPGQSLPSFQLDPKGHILGTLDIACTAPDAFVLTTDQFQIEGLEARLRRFVFISKVEITNRAETHAALLLRGVNWREAWHAAGLPPWTEAAPEIAPPTPLVYTVAEGMLTVSGAGNAARGEFQAPAPVLAGAWQRLAAVAVPCGVAVYEHQRILDRVPAFAQDIGERELPQETGQLDHLDYTKGCYVGQEIVERIRARGAVHRHFTAFRFAAPVAPGDTLAAAGQQVGRLTSVTPIDAGSFYALGYIRAPHDVPGTAITAAPVAAVGTGAMPDAVPGPAPGPVDGPVDGQVDGAA